MIAKNQGYTFVRYFAMMKIAIITSTKCDKVLLKFSIELLKNIILLLSLA